jgi:predicted choloylglycine hydrolase
MKKFPLVRAKGSHYEVGVAIGTAISAQIKRRLTKNRKSLRQPLSSLVSRIPPYLNPTKKYFPEIIAEMRGISVGAGVPFEEFLLGNIMELYNADRLATDNHCTIVAIPTENGFILGHNEDAQGYSEADLYLLDAQIGGTRLFGLSYVDGIIGSSVAVNGWGMVQAINSLPNADRAAGIPRNIVARAILECEKLAQVPQLLKQFHRASGYNHVLVQGAEVWNVESTAESYAVRKSRLKPFVHTNHYLTDIGRENTVAELQAEESKARYQKARQLLKRVSTAEGIMGILCDREEPVIGKTDTIGSCIIDPARTIAYISRGRPGFGTYYRVDVGRKDMP